MKKYFIIFSILIMGCGTRDKQRLMNQIDSVVVPAVSEYKRCESVAIKTEKSKCTLPLVKIFQTIDQDNPIKTLLVSYSLEIHELAINYDKNLIDDQIYELGKMKAKNNFDLNVSNLKTREKSIQNQNTGTFCRQVGSSMYCD